jgi:glycosyltransferase involved in cell wall biosynthesis
LTIVGSGASEGALRALAEELGVAERVRFVGFQAEVRPWLLEADGFVLSSLWEGLPVSLLEAGACGLPAVATDVAGVREVLADGETGFVAAAEDADSLRRAMLRLMQMRPENRRAMGMDARRRIEERFGLESVLDRWELLYRVLLEGNWRPRRWCVEAQQVSADSRRSESARQPSDSCSQKS